MPNLNVSKDMIVSIAEQQNKKFVRNTNKIVNQIMGAAIKELSKKISFLTLDKVVLQPANELISGAFIDGSSFIYFLGVQNVQLELNTNKKQGFWKSFKERLKYAWDNRKRLFRKRKHHLKKKKNEKVDDKDIEKAKIDPSKYTIYNLAEDLQKEIANYLSETSLIYLNKNLLQIVGKDDFGSNTKINIYVVNYDGVTFKYHDSKKRVFININFNIRIRYLDEKINAVGENFVKVLKIFNSLFYNTNGFICNQIFLESILCACPEDLFLGDDIYKVFLKIINYIAIKSIKEVKSINNPSLTIFQDEVCGNCILNFNRMMNRVLNN